MSMEIPTGYGILTGGLVLACIILLIAAGWSQKWLAVLAALGFCTLTSIFVIDVVSDGTVMRPNLALILVAIATFLVAPLPLAAAYNRRKVRKSGRSANPPNVAPRTEHLVG